MTPMINIHTAGELLLQVETPGDIQHIIDIADESEWTKTAIEDVITKIFRELASYDDVAKNYRIQCTITNEAHTTGDRGPIEQT